MSADDSRRVLTGSFAAPQSDAGSLDADPSGGSGGGANCSGRVDAGPCGNGASGASGASSNATGTSVTGASGALTLHQSYEAACDGATVQWGFFTYEASTPADSSIRFRIRTAASEGLLPEAESFDLATASRALGTDRCTMTGPAPCPIDLFVLLGGAPLVHQPVSSVEVVLTPASADGSLPKVDKVQLNYSCTFNQ